MKRQKGLKVVFYYCSNISMTHTPLDVYTSPFWRYLLTTTIPLLVYSMHTSFYKSCSLAFSAFQILLCYIL